MGSTELFTMDQIIRHLTNTAPDKVIISYPTPELEYTDYTCAHIDQFTRVAASLFPQVLKESVKHVDTEEPPVVGITGPSNLEYYVSFMALLRHGVTPLVLSPRLAGQGFAHLLRESNCRTVLASDQLCSVLERMRSDFDMPKLEIIPMASMETLVDHPRDEGFVFRQMDISTPSKSPDLLMHTGGTTGLPKLVPLCTGDWITLTQRIIGRVNLPATLSTLPIYHSHGQGLLIRSLVAGTKLALMNALRPITAGTVLAGLDKSGVSALDTDPYTLKILAEDPQGIERLTKLWFVSVGGSALPDSLGDHLITRGVRLRQLYGQTESGGLMAPSSDTKDGWNWLVPMPHVEPFLKFEKVDEDLYHLVVLPGLQTKRLTNRLDGAYGTNDLFKRHPSDPRKWKFAARHDDIIVMLNGEKADPTPLEHAVGGSEYVHVAVVFGAGRGSLGMFVVPSMKATGLSREELEEKIAANLDLGNSRVPGYAKVSMDSVVIKEVGTQVPMTPKATVIRPQVLAQFASDIDEFYAERERAQNRLAKAIPDDLVHTVVRRVVCTTLGVPEDGDGSITDVDDFFTLGMDSLLASHVRVRLLREINMGGRTLRTNVAFDHPTIEQLSQHILDMRHGISEGGTISTEELARNLVRKYTSQLSTVAVPDELGICESSGVVSNGASKSIVLLTGATGTIGRFILRSLLLSEDVERVYCLVRADSDEAATRRVTNALEDARLLAALEPSQLDKITALSSNIEAADLGLSAAVHETLRASVTTVIHNAWAVNFNMHLASFENPSIASVLHLLNFARQSTRASKPNFAFISSTATVLKAHSTPIAETRHEWDVVGNMGYAQSKWVAEEICTHAARHGGPDGPRIQIVRVGQITGDTVHGIWNPQEAIPSVVQTALTIGALPTIQGGDEMHFWLPVDICGTAVVQLALSSGNSSPSLSVFHVSNGEGLCWNADFLPALREAGLQFDELPQQEWVSCLEQSDPDVQRNPPYRLLEHFKERYGNVTSKNMVDDHRSLDISCARACAPALDREVRVDNLLVGKFVKYWLDIAWKDLPKGTARGLASG